MKHYDVIAMTAMELTDPGRSRVTLSTNHANPSKCIGKRKTAFSRFGKNSSSLQTPIITSTLCAAVLLLKTKKSYCMTYNLLVYLLTYLSRYLLSNHLYCSIIMRLWNIPPEYFFPVTAICQLVQPACNYALPFGYHDNDLRIPATVALFDPVFIN